MNRDVSARCLVACVLLAIAGCLIHHGPWDDYGGETLKVYGEPPGTAGQIVWQAVKDDPGVRDLLATQDEPDTLEIIGARGVRKTIVLVYTRPKVSGGPHTIQLDPIGSVFRSRGIGPAPTTPTPGSPARTPGPRRSRRGTKPPSETAESPGAPKGAAPTPEPKASGKPSPSMRVHCKIEPNDPTCQSYCGKGTQYEWCH